MLHDCHTHSLLSADGHATLSELARAAQAAGLGSLTLTEHVDLEFTSPGFDFDDGEYRSRYSALRAEMAAWPPLSGARSLAVYRGVEFGLQPQRPHQYPLYQARAQGEQYDFIIGSIHLIHGKDPYDGDFPAEHRAQTVLDYLNDIYAALDYLDYDVIGHIGYLTKYGNYPDHVLHYAEAAELIDAILRRVVAQGRGIELNSSTLARGDGAPMPEYPILRRYRELGGEIITLGSDAHRASEVARAFPDAAELLRAAGFEYACYFEARKARFERL